jgi:hypothetical protein
MSVLMRLAIAVATLTGYFGSPHNYAVAGLSTATPYSQINMPKERRSETCSYRCETLHQQDTRCAPVAFNTITLAAPHHHQRQLSPAGESAFNVSRMMGHKRSTLVDEVYANSMRSGMASIAENVTARALGVRDVQTSNYRSDK